MQRPPGWVRNPRPGVFYPTSAAVPRTARRLLDSEEGVEIDELAHSGNVGGEDDHDQYHGGVERGRDRDQGSRLP